MADALDTFLGAWRDFGRSPGRDQAFAHPMDRATIIGWGDRKTVCHRSWSDVIGDAGFGAEVDRRLHLGLVPQPFMGDLERARVVVLLLNPGLAPSDFHAEFGHPDFQEALLDNLRGNLAHAAFPFAFLDPTWAWTGGYAWWFARLRKIIARLEGPGVPRRSAQAFVAKHLACLQLIAYHSQSEPRRCRELPSVNLAIKAAAALLQRGKRVVVVRGHQLWDLPVSGERLFECPRSPGVAFPLRSSDADAPMAGDFIIQALQTHS